MEAKVEGDKLTITIPLAKTPRPSSTGKSLVLFSTEGFIPVGDGGDMRVNINVIRPRKASC